MGQRQTVPNQEPPQKETHRYGPHEKERHAKLEEYCRQEQYGEPHPTEHLNGHDPAEAKGVLPQRSDKKEQAGDQQQTKQ